ncbi:MAG TPA: 4-(cytidine 5'-diphospho)-2-C-methyl-D-erythritol kinase [Myxococcota bacterium]|nr:4-(cytidine 5'-diphospho)-2-C-methyl-D-erythritol kinase [Myxococcota bacterium]
MRAPAKVNLGLRVVGRRTDGYHELESLFVPLDLADELVIFSEPAAESKVSFALGGDAPGAPSDASNIAARAAELFLEETGLRLDITIALRKFTPVAAGLGGGSSDAAAVLLALSERSPGALPSERLRALALRLGADVPFFLDPRPSWVRGIGERIEPIAGVPSLALVLAGPGEPLATKEVFRAYDALAAAPAAPGPAPAVRLDDPAALTALLHNDLEAAAVRLCPAIRRLRGELVARGALAVGMSGSGPTLFGIFESPAAAFAAAAIPLQKPAWLRVATARESG